MDSNSSSQQPLNKADEEHGLISDLLTRLSTINVKDTNHLSFTFKPLCATPPNTPDVRHKQFTTFKPKEQVAPSENTTSTLEASGGADPNGIETAGLPTVEDSTEFGNGNKNKITENVTDNNNNNNNISNSAAEAIDAANETLAWAIRTLDDTRSGEIEKEETAEEIEEIKEKLEIVDEKDVKQADEHELIKDFSAKLRIEENLRNPAVPTRPPVAALANNIDSVDSSAAKLNSLTNASPPTTYNITRSNPSTDPANVRDTNNNENARVNGEEHSLISGYTSSLSRNSSLVKSPSAVRRIERRVVVRGASHNDGDDEHSLISGYSNSLAGYNSNTGTARTSRRSSVELDIEAVEEFYDTQRKVFDQLQQKNLELRKMIAQMKANPPASPHSVSSGGSSAPNTPEWNVSEYYNYTNNGENGISPGATSPRSDSRDFHDYPSPAAQRSFRMPGEGMTESERLGGEFGERRGDRNERLQMLREKREHLTKQLKQLLNASQQDAFAPSNIELEKSPSLSVN